MKYETEKILGYKSYGSIPHLSNSKINQQADKKIDLGQESILTKKVRDWKDLVIVQEKLDGSNVAVAKIQGRIYALGRSGYEAKTSEYRQHQIFDSWVMKNYNRFDKLLDEGERICGEWLYQVHTLKYNLTHEPFVVFDLFLNKEIRMSYIPFLRKITISNFIPANLVHIGQPITTERAMTKLGKNGGHNCQEIPEGVVYRLERDGKFEFLAKFVREGKLDGLYMEEEIKQINVEEYLK